MGGMRAGRGCVTIQETEEGRAWGMGGVECGGGGGGQEMRGLPELGKNSLFWGMRVEERTVTVSRCQTERLQSAMFPVKPQVIS